MRRTSPTINVTRASLIVNINVRRTSLTINVRRTSLIININVTRPSPTINVTEGEPIRSWNACTHLSGYLRNKSHKQAGVVPLAHCGAGGLTLRRQKEGMSQDLDSEEDMELEYITLILQKETAVIIVQK